MTYSILKKYIVLFSILFQLSNPYTHWFFDEKNNDIRPIQESPFALERFASVAELQKQEQEFEEIKKLQKTLINEKHILVEAEEEVDLESKHYDNDSDCQKATYRLPEYNLLVSTIYSPVHDGINTKPFYTSCTECPECSTKADYDSFNAETARNVMPYCSIIIGAPTDTLNFESMEGIKLSETFKEVKESPISDMISWFGNIQDDFEPRAEDHPSPYKIGDSVENMGHCITIGLSRNSQNWILFNLASIFWRIEGNAYEAIECARRSYHFAPDKYKDISLLNMANVLHKHGYTKNATFLLKKATTLNPKSSIHHFTLGNMFAHLEDYTDAIHHYNKAVEIQPSFTDANQRLYAVLCQAKLHHKLEQQHESLKKTLEELRKFKDKQDQYKARVDRLHQRNEMSSLQIENNQRFQSQREREGYVKKNCRFINDEYVCYDKEPELPIYTLQSQLNLEGPADRKADRAPIRKSASVKNKNKTNFRDDNFYFTVNQEGNVVQDEKKCSSVEHQWRMSWTDPNWPDLELCDQHVKRMPLWSDHPSAYIDPETRGFQVKKLFSDYLGIPDMVGSDHPWRPPTCSDWNSIEKELNNAEGEYAHKKDFLTLKKLYLELSRIQFIRLRHSIPMEKNDEYLLRALVDHVNSGRVWREDLGERINLAYKKAVKNDPEKLWLIYNVAGLFWRVNGSNAQALECIIRGYLHAPYEHQDILLHQMANILFRFKQIEDSIEVLRKSLRINEKETVSYYAMGNNLVARGNQTGAIEFYSYSLFLNNHFQEPFQCLFIIKCALKRKRLNLLVSDPLVPEGHDTVFWEKSWRPEMWARPEPEVVPEVDITIEHRLLKDKTMNESDEERILRLARRHQKFGKLAKRLSLQFNLPVEHIEVILEGIDDELNSKQRLLSDVSPYLEDDSDNEDFLTMEEKLKYKIAKTFLIQLQVKESEHGKKSIFVEPDK